MVKDRREMKKTEKKKSKPMINTKLKELIADIDNEIETVEHINLDNTFDVKEDQKRIEIGRYVCIELGNKQLAIPLTAVLEAGKHLSVRPLTLLPDWITGIANIRGEIFSVVSLNLFFDIQSALPHTPQIPVDNEPYLIVHNNDMKIAIIVDRILATRSLYSLMTNKFKKTQKKDMLSKYLFGQAFYEEENVQKEIFLFDLDKFLSSSSLHDFSTA